MELIQFLLLFLLDLNKQPESYKFWYSGKMDFHDEGRTVARGTARWHSGDTEANAF